MHFPTIYLYHLLMPSTGWRKQKQLQKYDFAAIAMSRRASPKKFPAFGVFHLLLCLIIFLEFGTHTQAPNERMGSNM